MELLRVQAREIVGEDLDVLVGKRLRGGSHVAVKIRASLRLELAQLRKEILVLLARKARNVLLAEEPRAMALNAIELL